MMHRQYAYCDPGNMSEGELKSLISKVLYENGVMRYSVMTIKSLIACSSTWTASTSNLNRQSHILDKKVCDFF